MYLNVRFGPDPIESDLRTRPHGTLWLASI